MLEEQAVALGAVLPLDSLAAGGIDEVRLEGGGVPDPSLDGPRRDGALDLVAADADETEGLIGRLGWKPWRERGPKRDYAADHVWFADDIFGFRVDWVREFAAILAEGGGGVPFTIQLRADLASPSMAAALREAGCREVWIGAESGSQKVLDAMQKGTRVGDIVEARRALGAEGIRVGFFLMLGYVGEELDDILATRDLLERTQPDDIGVSVAYPLPGTKFFDLVKRELGSKRNWEESNDLDMMFVGTYRSEFYRSIRNLLHAQVAEGSSAAVRRRWDALLRSEAEFRLRREVSAATRVAAHRAP